MDETIEMAPALQALPGPSESGFSITINLTNAEGEPSPFVLSFEDFCHLYDDMTQMKSDIVKAIAKGECIKQGAAIVLDAMCYENEAIGDLWERIRRRSDLSKLHKRMPGDFPVEGFFQQIIRYLATSEMIELTEFPNFYDCRVSSCVSQQ